MVFKVAGAAAEEGLDLDGVERAARRANDATFSFGIAFAGCTMPGADQPLFTVPERTMALGLGIHGEPGISDHPMADAAEIATILVDRLLAERPAGAGGRVGAILNGLGATKYEELFLLWAHVADRLDSAGLTVVRPEVGELVTSLDMAACSLTLVWLDEDLERWWTAAADTPAFRRPRHTGPVEPVDADEAGEADQADLPVADADSRAAADQVLTVLRALHDTLHEHAEELGRIDAVAGDGDHGRGMCKGVDAAVRAAERVHARSGGAASVLTAAGDGWADEAGGTSGVLWGAGLRAWAGELGDHGRVDRHRVVAGARAALTTITRLGKAEVGDKTLVDALTPLVEHLESSVSYTHLGRARPLAERSVGTPDAGATSLALCAAAVARVLATNTNQ